MKGEAWVSILESLLSIAGFVFLIFTLGGVMGLLVLGWKALLG